MTVVVEPIDPQRRIELGRQIGQFSWPFAFGQKWPSGFSG
jgi:hypothetical protein